MNKYYPTINLLRGLAAFLVCLFHFISHTDFRGDLFPADSMIRSIAKLGANGVYIFFVISGFVIPLSLQNSNYDIRNLFQFLSRRFIRIEIPYIASFLLILFVRFLFVLKNNEVFTFSTEQFLYHLVYYIPFSNYEWYNIIYWTLAIEFQFYMIIGLFYFCFSAQNNIILYTTLFLFGILSFLFPDHRFVFNTSTIFLQGIVLFLIKTEKIDEKFGYFLLFLAACATMYLHTIEISIFSIITVLAILFIEIDNKYSNRFGEISYSLYLTHGLIGGNILYLCARYFSGFSMRILLVIVAVLFSLTFAYLFWRFIENPSKKLSKNINVHGRKKHIS